MHLELYRTVKKISQIDKESLAIIFAVKRFHFFLYGKDRFTIYTDHKPLISLFGEHAKLPTLVAARLQRWALTLSAYNYKIEYRTGANNGNADALSRKPLVQTNLNAQIDGTINNVLNIETIPFTVTYDEIEKLARTAFYQLFMIVFSKVGNFLSQQSFCHISELKTNLILIRNAFQSQ